MKQSHSTDWSSTSMELEDFATKALSEREIIALFEKMMVRVLHFLLLKE